MQAAWIRQAPSDGSKRVNDARPVRRTPPLTTAAQALLQAGGEQVGARSPDLSAGIPVHRALDDDLRRRAPQALDHRAEARARRDAEVARAFGHRVRQDRDVEAAIR